MNLIDENSFDFTEGYSWHVFTRSYTIEQNCYRCAYFIAQMVHTIVGQTKKNISK